MATDNERNGGASPAERRVRLAYGWTRSVRERCAEPLGRDGCGREWEDEPPEWLASLVGEVERAAARLAAVKWKVFPACTCRWDPGTGIVTVFTEEWRADNDPLHVLGLLFRGWNGGTWRCVDHDWRGYWMVDENHVAVNVSERAIGGTYRRLPDPRGIASPREVAAVYLAEPAEYE
jgi:hypothetical protein